MVEHDAAVAPAPVLRHDFNRQVGHIEIVIERKPRNARTDRKTTVVTRQYCADIKITPGIK